MFALPAANNTIAFIEYMHNVLHYLNEFVQPVWLSKIFIYLFKGIGREKSTWLYVSVRFIEIHCILYYDCFLQVNVQTIVPAVFLDLIKRAEPGYRQIDRQIDRQIESRPLSWQSFSISSSLLNLDIDIQSLDHCPGSVSQSHQACLNWELNPYMILDQLLADFVLQLLNSTLERQKGFMIN